MCRPFFYFVLTLLSLGGKFELRGQTPSSPPHGSLLNFAPPTPNAASLGKFGDIPVGYCTGIPNISIPIYDYQNKANGLSLNIALNYHASGIRVQEKASNIGIGWALNAGGVITRELRGSGPDESLPGCTGYWSATALPNIGDYRVNENMYGTTIGSANPYWRFNEGTEDAEPDVFSFQCAGKSGKFIFGKNGQVWVYPSQKIIVEKLQNGMANSAQKLSFTLTTEDGIKYYFDEQENVSSYTQAGTIVFFGNSWYLSKIEAPFGEGQIDFSYDDIAMGYSYSGSQVYFKNPPGSVGDRQSVPVGSTQNRSFETKRLKQINFQNGVGVTFSYDPLNRCDVAGDNALKRIEITDGYTTYGFRLKQSYSFAYNGTESNSCSGLAQKDARLVLHEVIEYSGSTEKPPYLITYNTNSSSSLPDVMSNAQDHWGFFNGANGNSSLLPYDGLSYYNQAPAGSIDNADRRTNPIFAQEGIISKLNYPTGGYSEFTFESNLTPVGTNVSYNFQNAHVGINGFDQSMSSMIDVVKPSYFTTTQFNFEFSGFSQTNSNCSIHVKITSLDGSITYTQQILGPGTGYTKSATLTLPPGQYKYSYAFESGSQCTSELFVVSLDWQNITQNSSSSPEYAGGMRIQKIVENATGANGSNIKTRTYEYLDENGSSSGYLAIRPQYSYSFMDDCFASGLCPSSGPNGCVTKHGNYNVITSSSLFTLANSLGSPVLYSRVIERFTGDGTGFNGRIIRTFSLGSNQILPPDATIPDFFGLPYVTPQIPDWAQGQPLTEEVRDMNDQIVRRVNNEYDMPFSNLNNSVRQQFKGIKVYKSLVRWINGACIDYNRFLLNEYFPYSGLTHLAKTTETEFVNGLASLSKTTDYTYDPSYYGLTNVRTLDGKGNVEEQRIYYPYSYAYTGIHKEMVDANMIAPHISKESWKLNQAVMKVTGIEVTEFGKVNNTIIQPVKLYALESGQPLDVATIGNFDPTSLVRNTAYIKPKLELIKYDDRANLLEQNRVNDIKHTYLWGYKKSFPVVEVTGADYNTILATPGLDLSVLENTNGQYTDQQIRNETNKIRAYFQSTNVLVTTYTYKPLVGVTSQTDANGRTTYYEYDDFGRLSLIRDKDNNVLKKFCYNYQGQPEDCGGCKNTAANWQTVQTACESFRGVGNTGYQIITQQDVNSCSPTYGTTQDVRIYNPSACPPPCSTSTCQGPDHQCVNGVCEQGCKLYISSVKINRTTWQCTYVYKFSDGSQSTQQFTETRSTSCPVSGVMICD